MVFGRRVQERDEREIERVGVINIVKFGVG